MGRTRLYWHDDCLAHETNPGHPECAPRLLAIREHLKTTGQWRDLEHAAAPLAASTDIVRVHPQPFVDWLESIMPEGSLAAIDPDTIISPGSLLAARRAAGAAIAGVDAVLAGDAGHAFCLVRPPGHHAEPERAMGFCLVNSIAVAARHALAQDGIHRVAVLDFDVHHGNGTAAAFRAEPDVLVCSTYQANWYPYVDTDFGAPNIVNTPLPAGTAGDGFRRAVERDWLPALEAHQADLILVSAGFDAHRDDPLAQLALVEEDFAWVMTLIRNAAARTRPGGVVATLEGGYDLPALAGSAAASLAALG